MSPADHVRPGRSVKNCFLELISIIGDIWTQPGKGSKINHQVLKLPPVKSFLSIFTISSLKFKPEGVGVCSRNGGVVHRPKDAAVVSLQILQGDKSLSGTLHGDFWSDEDKHEILTNSTFN